MPRAVAATVLLFALGVVSAQAITSRFYSEFVLPHVENNKTLAQSVYDFIAELTAVAAYTPHNITFDYSCIHPSQHHI